jgi:hypothetical protein
VRRFHHQRNWDRRNLSEILTPKNLCVEGVGASGDKMYRTEVRKEKLADFLDK